MTLKGAQLAGNAVDIDVGRDLLIETLQDVSRYASKQSSSGFDLSLCIPPLCVGSVVQSASFSASNQKIKHNYQSAVGQSGIAAGEGGFDITVKGNTDLVGAAITSTAEADQNQFTTASLTSRDLTNTQETKANSSSIGVAYAKGGRALGTAASSAAGTLIGNLNGNATLPENGKETSETKSVISPATITLTGTGNQETDEKSQATADELTTRDPATANGSLKNTLTLQQAQVLERKIEEQKANQAAAQIVGAVLANAVGDYAQSMRKDYVDAEARDALDRKQSEGKPLSESERLLLARLDREGMTSDQALATLNDPAVKARYDAWADGSVQKTALHGIVGLIEAKIGDGNAAAGALGGMTQEKLAPEIAKYLEAHGIEPGSADYAGLMQLGTTLAGAAIGAATGGTQGAASGATSALVGVANNFLMHDEAEKRAAAERKRQNCGSDTACKKEATDEINRWNAIDTARDQEMTKACLSPSSAECLGWYTKLYEAQQSYVGANVKDFSVWTESGQITQQTGDVSQRINSAVGYNVTAGIIKSVAGAIAGPAELLALTGKALTGDEQAQNNLKRIADAVGEALSSPVDTVQQGIKSQIALANQLDAEGRTDEATQLRSQLVTDGVLTVAGLGTIAVKGTSAVVKMADNLLDQGALEALLKSGGALKNGSPLLDLKQLTTDQKRIMGELFGESTTKQIVPDGQKLARMQGAGTNGIDDLYKVSRTDVDYVVIEYKFVGSGTGKGSASLGNTADGLQASESWTLGSGRLQKAVGDEKAIAIENAIKTSRVETWVVTTRPDGSTVVEVLDTLGKPKAVNTSSILKSLSNLAGAKP